MQTAAEALAKAETEKAAKAADAAARTSYGLLSCIFESWFTSFKVLMLRRCCVHAAALLNKTK